MRRRAARRRDGFGGRRDPHGLEAGIDRALHVERERVADVHAARVGGDAGEGARAVEDLPRRLLDLLEARRDDKVDRVRDPEPLEQQRQPLVPVRDDADVARAAGAPRELLERLPRVRPQPPAARCARSR